MTPLSPKDLLLSEHLDAGQVTSLLGVHGFKEIKKADTNLQLIADEPRARQILSDIIEEFLRCLSRSPDPDQALNYFERFSRAAINKTQLLSYLKASPYTLWLLSKLFGSSPFLSEILIRNPTYLYWIADPATLEKDRPREALAGEISAALRRLNTKERKLQTLCILKRKELLRIGIRDLLKKSSVPETTGELSNLAEILIQKVYELCEEDMQRQYGIPMRRAGGGKKVRAAFTILGMGKLGGGELNFSSDVDLLYLYDSGEGTTSRSRTGRSISRISNTEYFRLLSQDVTSSLTEMTDEGYLYRVDLRLRPEGSAGQIACPLKGYIQYYKTRGETWERLALLKAWPVAGDSKLARRFLKCVSSFIYRQSFSLSELEEVKRLKERIDRKMLVRGESELNVKLGMGGIREIEFVVQALQTFFGGKNPKIRERNTLRALRLLHQQKMLPHQTCEILTEAYTFLRNVEHRLQMVHEFQTHLLPKDPRELRMCALRLDYQDREGASATDQFLREYRVQSERVRHIFLDLFHAPRTSPVLSAALRRTHQTLPKRFTKK